MRDPVLDGAFDAIITMSADGAVVDLNAAAERMFEVTREQAVGRELAALIIPEEQREEHRRALAAFRVGAPSRIVGRRLELYGLRGGTERFPLELSVSRVDTPAGPVFAAWIRDLSERRAAEEALRHSELQLRQAQKMEAVGRLAGGVAHDFNNVLTAIFGYADLLLDGFAAEDPRRADVEEIKRAANRAAALTRQLLAFSRKQVMQPRRLNLNDIIQNIQKLLGKLLGDEVELRVETDPLLGDVRADPGQLEQVLMNLAANARDAMPEGGRVTIVTANQDLRLEDTAGLVGLVPGSFVTLTVSDTGHGIPEQVRRHIFEPFYTTKAQGKGTGLGLATVYGIVKQSGGWIYLNEAPGPGASFRIYLPRLDAA
ncbi:MAG TPA: ATP-binding protein [Vicinamibacterales bacterium]|nr:ATP-binding protein [Vicinamibacterales bacterium]